MIGLSETRWIGFGEHVTGKGNSLIYSGKGEEEQHSEGIVRALLRRAARSLMEWQPQSLRIIYARFRKKISLLYTAMPEETRRNWKLKMNFSTSLRKH
jgi:hypothetical protein